MNSSPARRLAIVEDYDALVVALRARVDELRISHATLEALAGMAAGHVGKLLGPAQVKGIGWQSLWLLLGALGMRIVLEEDMAAVRRMESRYDEREERRRRPGVLRKQYPPEVRKLVAADYGRLARGIPKTFRLAAKERSKINRANVAKRKWRPVKRARKYAPLGRN